MKTSTKKTRSIEFSCNECERPIRVDASLAGRKGKCPGCSSALRVPSVSLPRARRSASPATALRAAAPKAAAPKELPANTRLAVVGAVSAVLWGLALFSPVKLGPTLGVFAAFGAPFAGVLVSNCLEAILGEGSFPLHYSLGALLGGLPLTYFGFFLMKGALAVIMGIPFAIGVVMTAVGVIGLASKLEFLRPAVARLAA